MTANGENLGALVEALSRKRVRSEDRCHLDPDLDPNAIGRAPGWKPLFGQVAAAQGHLAKHGVRAGDLFLYFGWFRETVRASGSLRYARNAPDVHVLFGWLQIGSIHPVTPMLREELPWAAYHHHLNVDWPLNTLYVAAEKLDVGFAKTGRPGAGTFQRFRPDLQLTASGPLRSVWQLPSWFLPGPGRPALSYHSRPDRWKRDGDRVFLKTVGRGQEFVLNLDGYPEALRWVQRLIDGGTEHG